MKAGYDTMFWKHSLSTHYWLKCCLKIQCECIPVNFIIMTYNIGRPIPQGQIHVALIKTCKRVSIEMQSTTNSNSLSDLYSNSGRHLVNWNTVDIEILLENTKRFPTGSVLFVASNEAAGIYETVSSRIGIICRQQWSAWSRFAHFYRLWASPNDERQLTRDPCTDGSCLEVCVHKSSCKYMGPFLESLATYLQTENLRIENFHSYYSQKVWMNFLQFYFLHQRWSTWPKSVDLFSLSKYIRWVVG